MSWASGLLGFALAPNYKGAVSFGTGQSRWDLISVLTLTSRGRG